MKALKNINMKWKLFALSIPLIIGLIISVIVAGIKINRTDKETTQLYFDRLYSVNTNLLNADRDLYQALNGATYYHDYREIAGMYETMLEARLNDYRVNSGEVLENVEAAAEIASKEEDLYRGITAEDGKTFEEAYDSFLKSFERWLDCYDPETDTGSWFHFESTFDVARSYLSDMQSITEVWAQQEHEKLVAKNRATIIELVIVFAIVIAVLIVLIFFILKQINESIREVTDSLDALAGGDLGYSFPDDDLFGRDELGHIHKSAKNLSIKLRDIIGSTKEMSDRLSASGEELANSSELAMGASEQITDAIGEISSGASGQAESVEVAAMNTSDIGDDIEKIDAVIESLLEKTKDMKQTCDDTMETMHRLLEQNADVVSNMKDIHAQISATNEAVKNIAEASKIITDISSQTNLLSLNASIEAARAGESGRGFAVVATEIGNLADQSGNAAVRISGIVKKLVEESGKSVATIEEMGYEFEKQNRQITDTNSDVEEMVRKVGEIAKETEEISDQVNNLNKAKESLVGIVTDLSAVSQENAASAEETNASMEELHSTFTLINGSASKLNSLALDLRNNISFFRE